MKNRRIRADGAPENKQDFRFKKSALAICVAAAAAQAPVQAQTNAGSTSSSDTATLEEVIVTGQRLNLQNAQEMKRNADTFLDAISAQDLGQLPDASVVEALQRVPGIAIERFAAPDDPDHYSTEGSDATLRGLPQTRTGINGRDSVAADSSNGLGFDDISPELLGSVEIFKNQTADMIEGGIAGTINLNTRKPFDSEGRNFSFSAQMSEGNLSGEADPGVSGVYSDRFEVASGEIGVLASYSANQLTFRADGSELGQHFLIEDAAGAGEDRWIPLNAGVRTTTTERDRQAASLAFQYRNSDDTLETTLEYIRSNSETDWLEYAFFSDDASRSEISADATFNDIAFTGGTLTSIGSGLGPQTRFSDAEEVLEEFSFNAEYQATDKLRLAFDVQFVDATTDIADLSAFGGIIPSTGSGIDILVDASGDTPEVDFLAPATSSQTDAEFFADPTNYFYRAAMDHLEESEGEQTAFQFDADYELDHELLDSIEFGTRFAERDQTTRWSTYNWGNLSEEWAGGWVDFNGDRIAPSWDGNAFGDIGDVASPGASSFDYPGFHNGNAGGAVDGLFINTDAVTSYDGFLDAFAGFGRGSLADRDGVVAGTSYLPAEINRVVEDNQAVYAKLNFGGDSRWSGNVGLRYVNIDTSVDGGETYPDISVVRNTIAETLVSDFGVPDLATALSLVAITDDQQAFLDGSSNTLSTESSYSTVLPSLNLKYLIGDDLVGRLAVSKSVAFADSGNLRYNYNYAYSFDYDAVNDELDLDVERRSGNPFLEPMESTDFDLGLEWYFADAGSLTGGIFYKDIKNFFANDTFSENVTNNGGTLPVDVSTTINLGEGSLKGFEVAYQQFFDDAPGLWSNVGLQFNATFLRESGVPNQNTRPVQSGSGADVDRATLPFEDLPLQGLSETTYNIVGMYEGETVRARLAYNYRSDYLLTIRQVNLGVPIYNEARGQLDGSIFFSVPGTEGLEIGLQAQNITNSESNTRMQVNQEGDTVVRSSFINDRRLALILKGSF